MDLDSFDIRQLDTVTRSRVEDGPTAADLRVPGLTILAHPDPRRIGERSPLTALTAGRAAALSRLEPFFARTGGAQRRPLSDPHLSRRPVRLTRDATGGGLTLTADVDLMVESVWLRGQRLVTEAELDRGLVLLLAGRVCLLLHRMEPVRDHQPSDDLLVGQSDGLVEVQRQIHRVARLDVPVMIRGETGTGKELVASAIQQGSPRRTGPFVAVNMGAVPPSLAAAELFGAARGAFTGADRRRRGYFERADGGTLFLDEVGETPPDVQAMLLRALETGLISAVGDGRPRHVDIRILAATDADLESEAEAGRFRAPLVHRLAGYDVRVPPLRDRREDVALLLAHFLRLELATLGGERRLDRPSSGVPWLPASLVGRLTLATWPGNVRQLRNVARQMVIAAQAREQLTLTPEIEQAIGITVPAPDRLSQNTAVVEAPTTIGTSTAGARHAPATQTAIKTLVHVELVETDRLTGAGALQRDEPRYATSVRTLLAEYDGQEIDGGPRFLLLFDRPRKALGYALEHNESIMVIAQEIGRPMVGRASIVLGEVTLRRNRPAEVARGAKPLELSGDSRELVAALIDIARPGQVLLNAGAYDLAKTAAQGDHSLASAEIRWLDHGGYTLTRDRGDTRVFEVGIEGHSPLVAPERPSPPSASDDVPRHPRSKSPKRRYRTVAEIDERELVAALRSNAFRIQQTAKALGVSRGTLYRLIERSTSVRKAIDLTIDDIEKARAQSSDLDQMAATLEVSRKGLRRRMTDLGI